MTRFCVDEGPHDGAADNSWSWHRLRTSTLHQEVRRQRDQGICNIITTRELQVAARLMAGIRRSVCWPCAAPTAAGRHIAFSLCNVHAPVLSHINASMAHITPNNDSTCGRVNKGNRSLSQSGSSLWEFLSFALRRLSRIWCNMRL